MRGHSLLRALRQRLSSRDAHDASPQHSNEAKQISSSGWKQRKRQKTTSKTNLRTRSRETLRIEKEGDHLPGPSQVVSRIQNEDSIEAHSLHHDIVSETHVRNSIYIVSEDTDDAPFFDSAHQFPIHPIYAFQEAFEESTIDAVEGTDMSVSTSCTSDEAEARRKDLLDQDSYEEYWAIRWKQRSSAKHHPLLKAVAQITYGMHLLQYEQAESEVAVVEILQDYVDIIDGFLERTDQDFQLASKDTKAQTGYLRLLMQYPDVSEKLLHDKVFRTQLISGNEKLEKVIQRTLQAVNAAMYDHEKCMFATKELDRYLLKVKDDWPQERSVQITTFVAMLGNKDGWLHYLHELQRQGRKLCVALIQLRTLMEDMSKLIAVASRRNTIHSYPENPSTVHIELYDSLNKPLPREPDSHESALVATVPKIQSIVISESLDRVYRSFRSSTEYPDKTHHRPHHNHSLSDGSKSQTSRAGHDSMFSQ